MKVNKFRSLQSTNVIGRKKLIYLSVDKREAELLDILIEKYIGISKGIGLHVCKYKTSLHSNYEAWVTYEIESIGIYIIERLLNEDNRGNDISSITADASMYLKKIWYYDIQKLCEGKGIPFLICDEKKVQLGYGNLARVITEKGFFEEYENNASRALEGFGIKDIIPIISVTGTNGKTSTVRLIHKILIKLGYYCGLSSTGGIFIGDNGIKYGDTTGFYSAQEVLKNKEIEVAVLETARGGIIKKGLGYELAKVCVITSLSKDHFGMSGVSSLDELGKIKCLTLKNLREDGIIIVKADESILKLINNKNEKILFYDYDNNIIKKHVTNGGSAIYENCGDIVYNKSGVEEKLIGIKDVPFAYGGISKSNLRNIMASIACVYNIHKNITDIINVIKELECDLHNNPGRQNIINIKDFSIILDYGHNIESFMEVFNIAKNLKGNRIISIITAAGDRRDEDIVELGKCAGRFSDQIIIREQKDRRGREEYETANLLLKGVLMEGFERNKVQTILKEEEAIIVAMKNAKKGDIIILFTQCLEIIVPAIDRYLKSINLKSIGDGLTFYH